MIERRNGTYGACKYSEKTKSDVREWLKQADIPTPVNVDKLHTTVIYSRKPVIALDKPVSGVSFKIKRFDRFETKPGGSTFALVGVLEAKMLEDIHEKMKLKGATHDFPEYHPHVTFTYDLPADFDLASLEIPQISFEPVLIYFEPLDLNWEGT